MRLSIRRIGPKIAPGKVRVLGRLSVEMTIAAGLPAAVADVLGDFHQIHAFGRHPSAARFLLVFTGGVMAHEAVHLRLVPPVEGGILPSNRHDTMRNEPRRCGCSFRNRWWRAACHLKHSRDQGGQNSIIRDGHFSVVTTKWPLMRMAATKTSRAKTQRLKEMFLFFVTENLGIRL